MSDDAAHDTDLEPTEQESEEVSGGAARLDRPEMRGLHGRHNDRLEDPYNVYNPAIVEDLRKS